MVLHKLICLGLTEAWINKQANYVYPMCPGTVAGHFDASHHQFKNYNYPEIYTTLNDTLDLLKTLNPKMRFLLTVSPVPLTATSAGEHVLTATTHSKSILRAVAGELKLMREDTDYFPSYEIISAFPFKGQFYADNLRNVLPKGVSFVMESFFACQRAAFGETNLDIDKAFIKIPSTNPIEQREDEVCEDILLEKIKK